MNDMESMDGCTLLQVGKAFVFLILRNGPLDP